jgi:type III pantothenate kinase
MKPDWVVDVGNSRIKWGRCLAEQVADGTALPPDDPTAWEESLRSWIVGEATWAVGGVHPERIARLTTWLRERGQVVVVLDTWQQLPIRVEVDFPSRVGLDRLFNVIAAKDWCRPEIPLCVVDAGSAVTVDWVDEHGAFRGGAIFPGFGLMAKALHDYTALLPQIPAPPPSLPILPGTNTEAAMQAGIFWAVVGGIRAMIHELFQRADSRRHREIFLTGGDAGILACTLGLDLHVWPTMTLEGIRLAAEAQP